MKFSTIILCSVITIAAPAELKECATGHENHKHCIPTAKNDIGRNKSATKSNKPVVQSPDNAPVASKVEKKASDQTTRKGYKTSDKVKIENQAKTGSTEAPCEDEKGSAPVQPVKNKTNGGGYNSPGSSTIPVVQDQKEKVPKSTPVGQDQEQRAPPVGQPQDQSQTPPKSNPVGQDQEQRAPPIGQPQDQRSPAVPTKTQKDQETKKNSAETPCEQESKPTDAIKVEKSVPPVNNTSNERECTEEEISIIKAGGYPAEPPAPSSATISTPPSPNRVGVDTEVRSPATGATPEVAVPGSTTDQNQQNPILTNSSFTSSISAFAFISMFVSIIL